MKAYLKLCGWLALFVLAFRTDEWIGWAPENGLTFLAGVAAGIAWAALSFCGWVWSFVKAQAAEDGRPEPRLRDVLFASNKEKT